MLSDKNICIGEYNLKIHQLLLMQFFKKQFSVYYLCHLLKKMNIIILFITCMVFLHFTRISKFGAILGHTFLDFH